MPLLNQEQARELHDVLLRAFPDENSLQRLTRFAINQNLSAIVGSGTVSDWVLDLIVWAEAHGCIEELIRGAVRERPKVHQLRSIAAQLGIDIDTIPPPVSPGFQGSQSSRIILRREAQIPGSFGTFPIYIDGVKHGSVSSGESVTIDVTPGPHNIQVKIPLWPGSKVLPFTVEEGEEAVFVCRYGLLGFGALEIEQL